MDIKKQVEIKSEKKGKRLKHLEFPSQRRQVFCFILLVGHERKMRHVLPVALPTGSVLYSERERNESCRLLLRRLMATGDGPNSAQY